MIKELKHIIIMILLFVAMQATGQSYVIDKVCVGSTRLYRIEGDAGSSYEWILTNDITKLKVPIPNPAGTPFTKTNGKTIYGNEISINWKDAGTFVLAAIQTSLLGCDTLEQGLVEVYELPTVLAGNPLTICSDMKVGLTTGFAKNESSLEWTSSGDGTFDNPKALYTSYNIGPNDVIAGSVQLTLTAHGKGNAGSCNAVSSTLTATLKITPKLVINDPPEVCLPTTVDLSAPSVTSGSDPNLDFEYFKDQLTTITLVNYKNVSQSGTYYIRAKSKTTGCEVLKPVNVKFTKQIVPSFAHIDEICLNSINPPVLQPSDFLGITGSWSPSVITTNVIGKFPYKFTPDPGQCAKDTTIIIEVSNSIKPTFTIPLSYCLNEILPPLPLVSNNGISGVWDKPTILTNSIGKTSYTFFPGSGQCGVPETIQITINFPGSPPSFTIPKILCVGSVPPILPSTSNEGVSGVWGPSVISTASPGITKYTFTPNSGQCVQTRIEQIEIIDKVIPTFDQVGPLCLNSTPFVLPVTSKNGIKGTWTPAIVSTNVPGNFDFEFVPDASFCAEKLTMTVKVYDQIKLFIVADPLLTFGGTTKVTVTATGGSGVFVSGIGTFFMTSGTHTFTVMDDHGCESLGTITIMNPQDLNVTTSIKPIKCIGGFAEVTVSVSGGAAPYTYTYNGGDPSHIHLSANTFLVRASAIPYVFVVTDKDGLHGETSPILISNPPGLTLTTLMTKPTCFGGSDGTATVTIADAMGPVQIEWDDPLKQTTAKATGLKAGVYTVKVTDDCGPKQASVTVTDPPAIVLAAVGVGSVCPGSNGSIQFTVTNVPDGIYNIQHSAGQFNSVSFSGGKASVSAPVGTYNNIVISYNSCSSVGVKATVDPAPVQPIGFFTIQPTCKTSTGSVFITTPKQNSGFEYSIDHGVYQATTTFAGLTTGTHILQIRKISTACEKDTTFSINAQPLTPANLVPVVLNPECETSPTQVLDATKGIAPPPAGITVIWYDSPVGGKVVSSPILNTATSITYYAEAFNGICSSPSRTPVKLTIVAKPPMLVSSGDIRACETKPMPVLDARTAIPPAPGKNIRWFDQPFGGNLVASPTLNAVKSVTYYAEDFNGTCSSVPRTAVKLTIDPLPVKPALVINLKPKCTDLTGVVEVKSPIGPDYLYSIDNEPYQSSRLFNRVPGKHFVRVKNSVTTCESDTAAITVPNIPPVPKMKTAAVEDCICYGDSGKINFEFVNVPDGTYVIIYMGGQFKNVKVKNGKASVKALAGTYNILAIEANGCTSTENWNLIIKQPDQITISGKITEIDLKSQTLGAIDISISGGTGQYQTVWKPDPSIQFAGSTSEDISNLRNGDYLVTVTDKSGCKQTALLTIPMPNFPPIATNDEFFYLCSGLTGDVVNQDNGNGVDSDPEGGPILIDPKLIEIPKHGTLIFDPDQSGKFTYKADQGYTGTDQFKYRIYDIKNNFSDPATVIIHIVSDFDGDGIADDLDVDADGDGILNVDEVIPGQDWKTVDSDGDGHPNWLDIDSDNDGIVDNIEGQTTAGYIPPSGKVTKNGLDLAYDSDSGGKKIVPVDTDKDGIPDFLDVDSDNDGVPDYIEGHDLNADGKPDQKLAGKDSDGDGLDDGYDEITNACNNGNATGAIAPVQDFDGDGMPDFRDDNDDNDQYPTRFEDLNADGDYSNDDTDFDGHPEYLDYGRDCELYIPDAFSPNGDNIHDYFQIYCIDHFPNAKIFIFDQAGNKLYEKDHYGNLEFWGTPERAWWDGRTTNRAAITNMGKVTQGTYYYVLQLGNGEVRKSFVFVSY